MREGRNENGGRTVRGEREETERETREKRQVWWLPESVPGHFTALIS